MAQNIFISYSRREVGFVDDLVRRLEAEKYVVWLDYRSLVAGSPWQDQIYKGITDAEVILLVISKESLASRNVEVEWQRVLGEKKRIILLIFEAVELPPVLEKYEWVDFRGNYKAGLDELFSQLKTPVQEEHPVPQTGFKVPAVVWLSFILSIPAAIFSLISIWTLFIPFFLVPLPYRIFKRDFSYLPVQASLLMMPFAIFLTANLSVSDTLYDLFRVLAVVSLPLNLWLMYLLRSEGMQRWGKPSANSPAKPHVDMTRFPQDKPIKYFIDHAPQDREIAISLDRTFKSAGHIESAGADSAKATFTLISRFKTESVADCESQLVYPVIVQSNDKISPQLLRIQWLDMRSGVRNLDVIARLLPDPALLSRGLCVRPSGNQLVLPSAILALIYFIVFLAVVCIGSWFPYISQYANLFFKDPFYLEVVVQLIASLILFGGISYFMVRHIMQRQGFFASLPGLLTGAVLFAAILYWQVAIDNMVFDLLGVTVDYRGISSYYPRGLYMIGLPIMLIYLWFNRHDLMYWLPAKKPKQ